MTICGHHFELRGLTITQLALRPPKNYQARNLSVLTTVSPQFEFEAGHDGLARGFGHDDLVMFFPCQQLLSAHNSNSQSTMMI